MRHTHYTGRVDCLQRMSYESIFFTAVKVRDFEPDTNGVANPGRLGGTK